MVLATTSTSIPSTARALTPEGFLMSTPENIMTTPQTAESIIAFISIQVLHFLLKFEIHFSKQCFHSPLCQIKYGLRIETGNHDHHHKHRKDDFFIPSDIDCRGRKGVCIAPEYLLDHVEHIDGGQDHGDSRCDREYDIVLGR